MNTNNDISTLLGTPIWQMTGADFVALTKYANAQVLESDGPVRVIGVCSLADYLGCCASTVYMLKRAGVLDAAIVSRVGKRIVFDGELARAAADRFQKEKRHEK